MSTRIYAPDGVIGDPGHKRAPSPHSISGLRIVVLDNGKPGAARVLSGVARGLSSRTGATFVGVVQKGSAATPCEPELLQEMRARGDLFLTGTAD